MSLRDVARNLRDVTRRHGPVSATLFAWSALNRGTCCYLLFGLSSPRNPPEPPEDTRGHCFRLATPEEIAGGHGLWTGRDLDAIQRGDRCLVQWDGTRLAGYTWASASPLVSLTEGVHLNLPDDTAYIYKAYTSPDYRGRGSQTLRSLELLRLLRPEGKRRLFAYVERDNFDSLKAMRRTGYHRVGTLTVVRRRGLVRISLRVSNEYWSDLRRA